MSNTLINLHMLERANVRKLVDALLASARLRGGAICCNGRNTPEKRRCSVFSGRIRPARFMSDAAAT